MYMHNFYPVCVRSRVMSLVMSVCVYVAKKLVVWGFTAWKSLVGAIYCSLIEFNYQKRSLLCQVICSEKEIWRHSINRMGKGFLENCITVSHTSSTCSGASYAMLLQLQCRTATLLQVQSVLTMLSVHSAGYVFCGTLVHVSFLNLCVATRGEFLVISSLQDCTRTGRIFLNSELFLKYSTKQQSLLHKILLACVLRCVTS